MVSIILVLVLGVLPMLTLYLLKLVIDAVTAGCTSSEGPIVFKEVVFLIVLWGFLSLIRIICQSLSRIATETQAQAVMSHVQTIIHSKAIDIDLEDYENPECHDLLYQAQSQAPYRPSQLVRNILTVSQNAISLMVIGGLLFSIYWELGVILVISAIPGTFIRLKYAQKIYDWYARQAPKQRLASYLHTLLVDTRYVKESRLFDLGNLIKDRSFQLRESLRKEKFQLDKKRAFVELLPNISSVVVLFTSFGFIAYRALQGVISLGDMVMYYQAFLKGQAFLSSMLGGLVGFYENSLFLSMLYNFLDIKKKIKEPILPETVPRPIKTGLTVENLYFRYPNLNRDILKNISLTISPGEVVGFVGENGSGKTTLVKLICRLYDPMPGRICLDGIDLKCFNTKDLRREIGVVFQDFNQYNLTVRENIWFGNIDAPLSDKQIYKVAGYSGMHNFITSMNSGYETVLGRGFMSGEELSTGQWQKIAFARAMFRNPQIMILDEPTSSMDPKAEQEIFKKFKEISSGRMTILISHRLSTVTMADRIFVFEKGRIVESGAHVELMQRNGLYSNMFERQAKGFM